MRKYKRCMDQISSIRAKCAPSLAECPAVPPVCPAPREWQITCHHYAASWHSEKGLLGFADLEIAGGLRLHDLRIVTTDAGPVVAFPKRGVLKAGDLARFPNGEPRLIKPVSFVDADCRASFTAAALRAIHAAFPGAIPETLPPRRYDRPNSTRNAASVTLAPVLTPSTEET